MKKVGKLMLGLMLSIVVVMTLSGCQDSTGDDKPDTTSEPKEVVYDTLIGTWMSGGITNFIEPNKLTQTIFNTSVPLPIVDHTINGRTIDVELSGGSIWRFIFADDNESYAWSVLPDENELKFIKQPVNHNAK